MFASYTRQTRTHTHTQIYTYHPTSRRVQDVTDESIVIDINLFRILILSKTHGLEENNRAIRTSVELYNLLV